MGSGTKRKCQLEKGTGVRLREEEAASVYGYTGTRQATREGTGVAALVAVDQQGGAGDEQEALAETLESLRAGLNSEPFYP